MKPKHPDRIIMFGVVTSDNDIMPQFIWPHGFRFNTGTYMPGDSSADLDQESDSWKTLHLVTGHCAMSHGQENPVFIFRKFLQPHHP